MESLGIEYYAYTSISSPLSFDQYSKWVDQGHHLPLTYMEGERLEKRRDLACVFPPFQSALVFLFSYKSVIGWLDSFYKSHQSNGLRVAYYSLGFDGYDYHHFVKDSLHRVARLLMDQDHELKTLVAVDTHPILERDLALRSGLGWIGKNSMLIHPKGGSYYMIASLLLSKKWNHIHSLPPMIDHCGNCTRCIDTCPTQAILDNRTIDASLCISTFTIEIFQKNDKAPKGMEKGSGEIFGCDICQKCCPWNNKIHRQSKSAVNLDFTPTQKNIVDFFLGSQREEILTNLKSMSKREFRRMFKGTAFERTGRDGIIKNIEFHESNISFADCSIDSDK